MHSTNASSCTRDADFVPADADLKVLGLFIENNEVNASEEEEEEEGGEEEEDNIIIMQMRNSGSETS